MPRYRPTPTPRAHRLRNGLRVITTSMPNARSTSIALAIRAGSIFDPPGANGLAHFLEHLIFKSTDDYSRAELAAAMQACGNGFDPTTSKETISLAGTVPAHRTEDALHLLASVTQRPRFDARDFETERQVVLEELRDWEEDPSKRIEVLADAALWGSHPLGRDIGGTRMSVRDLTRAQVRRFHRRFFHPRNAVLSMAGPLSAGEMLAGVREHFAGWRAHASAIVPGKRPMRFGSPAVARSRRGKVLRRTSSQQVWFSISTTTPSYPQGFDAIVRAQLAQVLLGDGDGSRLWDGLREKLGLAYEVYATLDFYRDVGVMSAMAAVGRGRAAQAVREAQRILAESSHGYGPVELGRGKDALAAQIDLYAEWNAATAGRYAQLALFGQPLVTPSQELDAVQRVEAGEFNDFVRERIRWQDAAVCAIGDAMGLNAVRG